MHQRIQSLVAPCKETAVSGVLALELETELLEYIIHHLGNLLQLHTLKTFNMNIFGY